MSKHTRIRWAALLVTSVLVVGIAPLAHADSDPPEVTAMKANLLTMPEASKILTIPLSRAEDGSAGSSGGTSNGVDWYTVSRTYRFYTSAAKDSILEEAGSGLSSLAGKAPTANILKLTTGQVIFDGKTTSSAQGAVTVGEGNGLKNAVGVTRKISDTQAAWGICSSDTESVQALRKCALKMVAAQAKKAK